jgi:hypothetical protein
LENVVVGPLQKRAVDVDNRPQARLRLPRGKGHGVRFANACVEKPLGERIANFFQFVSLAHCRSEHGSAGIIPQLRFNRLGSHVCI